LATTPGDDVPALHRSPGHGLEGPGAGAPRLSDVLLAESEHEAILVQADEHVAVRERPRVLALRPYQPSACRVYQPAALP
jgi:hypothetical protein